MDCAENGVNSELSQSGPVWSGDHPLRRWTAVELPLRPPCADLIRPYQKDFLSARVTSVTGLHRGAGRRQPPNGPFERMYWNGVRERR